MGKDGRLYGMVASAIHAPVVPRTWIAEATMPARGLEICVIPFPLCCFFPLRLSTSA